MCGPLGLSGHAVAEIVKQCALAAGTRLKVSVAVAVAVATLGCCKQTIFGGEIFIK